VEILWSPWRSAYINSVVSEQPEKNTCIFCTAAANRADDEKNFVLHRAAHNFVILNRYPYVSGHLMIAPYEHLGEFFSAPKVTTDEMMDLAKRCQTALRESYKAEGFNLGMNLGRAAGAGVVDHIHMHIMPRWIGDTNFMTSVGDTRVLPEDLTVTFHKLRGKI
jgi:ATP adenylyltransferase